MNSKNKPPFPISIHQFFSWGHKIIHMQERQTAREAIDLLIKYYSTPMFRFRLRLCKNYSTYTPYMLNNFCFVSHEI